MRASILFVVMCMTSHAFSNPPKVLVQTQVSKSLINEIKLYKPVKDHKFNTKSKHKCGAGRLISSSKKEIVCQMTEPGDNELELFVCDKKNTYCKREIVNVSVDKPKGFKSWLSYYWVKYVNKAAWQSTKKTGQSYSKAPRGFLHNKLKLAISKAKQQDKKILLFVTQIYCPPCRMVKELVLNSKEFDNVSKNYIKVQLDTDLDLFPELFGPLKYKYTPTFIILDKNFKELDRNVGAISVNSFREWDLRISKYSTIESLTKKTDLTASDTKRLFYYWKERFEPEEAEKLSSQDLGDIKDFYEILVKEQHKKTLPLLKSYDGGVGCLTPHKSLYMDSI